MLKPLRTGYTTGACATAATGAALRALLDGVAPNSVAVDLPSGKRVTFPVALLQISSASAGCGVMKDAGDDPDVTGGLMICSEVALMETEAPGSVTFLQGEGVGTVTLKGLEVPPGEPAINPVPRRMITECVARELKLHPLKCGVSVRISVPGGEAVAAKTMNARIGITGGISIIGTTGEVVPYSLEAWVASIRQAVSVAAANGCHELLLSAGARSEGLTRSFCPQIGPLCSIHYGNFIGRSLQTINEHGGFRRVTIGVMLAKATKLAQGELDLSSRVVSVKTDDLAAMAKGDGYSPDICKQLRNLKLARNMTEIVPFRDGETLYRTLVSLCLRVCRRVAPELPITFVLLDMEGRFMSCSSDNEADGGEEWQFGLL